MYNTNQGQDRYCLLYYVLDNIVEYYEPYVITHQIIPYCLRSSEESPLVDFSSNNRIYPSFTFAQLREKNISSRVLLSWSASIDLAERYEIFLSNISYSSLFVMETLFFNCTSPWFGPHCRFAFFIEIDQSYDEIVRSSISSHSNPSCYKHLGCDVLLFCLDWREICDRKMDCFDGSDESGCWQLEMNECAENEFRCHNGQCIPMEFFHDVTLNPDCLDRTDERVAGHYPAGCASDPAFRCEENMCRSNNWGFPCGDGACAAEIGNRCENDRNVLLHDSACSNAMACLMKIVDQVDEEWCKEFCSETNCAKANFCPSLYDFPSGYILFGHVRFMFTNNETKIESDRIRLPDYVCYNEKLCSDFLSATVYLNNLTCRHFYELGLKRTFYESVDVLVEHIRYRFRACLVVLNETHYCNHSTMYQCSNSTKCISKHRIVDGIRDCPFGDDETFNQSCSLNDAKHRFICSIGDNKKCLAPVVMQDNKKDCENGQDEYENHIYFRTICDGMEDMPPILIDERNHTDETECDHWLCDNTYTRCDGFWSCKDGADEINCASSTCRHEINCPSSTCSQLEHSCVFPNDITKVSCLPIVRAGDGNADCLGWSDERNNCRTIDQNTFLYDFQCWNDTKCINMFQLCDKIPDCQFGDDEVFCENFGFFGLPICIWPLAFRSEVEQFFCDFTFRFLRKGLIYFELGNMSTYSLSLMTDNASIVSMSVVKSSLLQSSSLVNISNTDKWQCNRGVPVHIRMEDDTYQLSCLCPPSYYGNQCQYQNQRVSLTLQIRFTSDWRSVFTFIITLIDDMENIESHDHIEYLPIRDCDTKFNIYLLYATRPKNSSKAYSVQIHAFNTLTMDYRASWIFPLRFSFLPVHRLTVLLTVPILYSLPHQKCVPSCIHGECFSYVNLESSAFCRCLSNWSGAQCTVKQMCDCALSSLCIGDSICVCPLTRFGPRCYLPRLPWHSESCANGGQSVPRDERHTPSYLNKTTCVCPQEYSGDRCEYRRTRIDIFFHNRMNIPPSLIIHFITVGNKTEHVRTSVMKKITFDRDTLVLYTSVTFNIAFVQILNEYYLIVLREQAIVSDNFSTEIIPSHRCASIHELFNETVAKEHLLKRIKLYHIPCRERVELVCFYDSVHLCICDSQRRGNCFEFNHNMIYDCHGYNSCENNGQCFLDNPKCPTSSICVCRDCYYGSKCQFSTRGSILSLDAILGYGIRPNQQIKRQSTAVKVAMGFSTTIFGLGLLSSLLSLMTFQTKETRNVGCGLYLLVSSITSLITISVLNIKFWLLLLWQMNMIKNKIFIHIQCLSLDYLLQVLVSSNDWLSACVAIERAVTASKGPSFDKAKSKRVAKWMVSVVFLLTSCAHIHDPIYRQLIDDEEEQRTWCVTNYSPSLQLYDRVLNVVHFSVPFGINCISALVCIIVIAHTRSHVQRKQSYKRHLHKQFQQHKHLLISPFILVLLTLPRLIISFSFGCMKSARDPQLHLIGYFISFISPMMTFIVFVLPSEMYKQQLKESIKRFWQRMRANPSKTDRHISF